MKENLNKFIAVSYKLYAVNDGETELVEEATAEQPYEFLSGFGITLEEFEKAIVGLNAGEEFDIKLSPEMAYGDYEEEHILDLDKSIFFVDGQFDEENIYEDAVVPLQNEDGNRFMGHVLEVSENQVKIDLNHPLAGQELNFKGKVIESREATNEEIAAMVDQISGAGCGCGGNCGGDCDCDQDGEGCGDNCSCGSR